MEDKIRILVKRVGQAPTVEEVENKLESFQAIVGGSIEIPYSSKLPRNVNLVCNDEGKLIGLDENIYWGDDDIIYGDIFFLSHNEDGEAISLSDEQIEGANKFIKANSISNTSSKRWKNTHFWRGFVQAMKKENYIQSIKDKKDMEM